MPTTPTQIRLTDQDKAKIEDIRERFGLPSMASAIRYAVETVHRGLDQAPREKNPRKSRQPA
jgi:Arc/MetJ-type ribon-helix-helix transcriptional regulator